TNVNALHAHQCKACAGNGITSIWIHAEKCRGVEQAHKCPQCGALEWEKRPLPLGKLPQHHGAPNNNQKTALATAASILYWTLAIVALSVIAYEGYRRYGHVKDAAAKIAAAHKQK